MKVGFIGLGNVGGKLAGSLLRNGIDLVVLDRKPELRRRDASNHREDGRSKYSARIRRPHCPDHDCHWNWQPHAESRQG